MTKKNQNLIEREKEDGNNKYCSYLQFSSPAILLRPAWGTVYKKKKKLKSRGCYISVWFCIVVCIQVGLNERLPKPCVCIQHKEEEEAKVVE